MVQKNNLTTRCVLTHSKCTKFIFEWGCARTPLYKLMMLSQTP